MASSSQAANVLTLWPEIALDLFAPVEQALRERGHRVRRFPDVAALRTEVDALRHADVIYAAGPFRLDRSVLTAAPRLRALVSPITGVDTFDLEAANELRILIANGQVQENYESMAEATVLLILACLYDLQRLERQLREQQVWRTAVGSRMLKGKTVGLIGFGQIARSVAERLQHWGVRLVAYMPRLRTPLPEYVQRIELDDLLRESDVICVLASLNAETFHLLNEARLELTKPGCSLVNVARGAIIDEQALYRLAARGHFRRLALDAFETEPLPADSPLRALPETILTPHAIGHTVETHSRLAAAAIENIECVLQGTQPPYAYNPQVLPDWLQRWSPA
jgi:phosphoglycerate dehydrogenase-like enzyme